MRSLLSRKTTSDEIDALADIPEDERPLSFRKLLIAKVIIAGGNYSFLSLVDIGFRALQPLFLSTPIELGGLGLAPHQIGKILSAFGVLNGFCQIFFFARLHDYLGSKKLFTIGLTCGLPLIALFPIINGIAKTEGLSPLVWVLVGSQTVLSVGLSFSYGWPSPFLLRCGAYSPISPITGAVFIYIAAASPNRASLGGTNGLCQMTVSVFRAIGPAATNGLFSLSISEGYLGGFLVYYVLLATSAVSLGVASLLPGQVLRRT